LNDVFASWEMGRSEAHGPAVRGRARFGAGACIPYQLRFGKKKGNATHSSPRRSSIQSLSFCLVHALDGSPVPALRLGPSRPASARSRALRRHTHSSSGRRLAAADFDDDSTLVVASSSRGDSNAGTRVAHFSVKSAKGTSADLSASSTEASVGRERRLEANE
jgi:hypothetical protein